MTWRWSYSIQPGSVTVHNTGGPPLEVAIYRSPLAMAAQSCLVLPAGSKPLVFPLKSGEWRMEVSLSEQGLVEYLMSKGVEPAAARHLAALHADCVKGQPCDEITFVIP